MIHEPEEYDGATMISDEVETIFRRLAAPFDAGEVRSRVQSGREFHYITPRTARRRLNEVLGPDRWECQVEAFDGGVRCSLTVHLPDGRSLTRSALGGYPQMPAAEDAIKGGDSDAFKRACVLFGVGEYLYGEEAYGSAQNGHDRGDDRPPAKGSGRWIGGGYTRRLELDENGNPLDENGRPIYKPAAAGRHWPPRSNGSTRSSNGNGRGNGRGEPRTGRALFAHLRELEEHGVEGVVNYLTQWGKQQGFPNRFTDWTSQQVAEGVAEAGYYAENGSDR